MSGGRVFIYACIALVAGVIVGVSAVEYGRQSHKAEPVRSVFAESEKETERE